MSSYTLNGIGNSGITVNIMQRENPIVEAVYANYQSKNPELKSENLAEFRDFLDIFYVVHDRYIFHSENSLNASTAEVKRKLLLYHNYQPIIEKYYKRYKQRLLQEYLFLAQFCWHWYEIVEAEIPLKQSAALWFLYNLPIKPARCNTWDELYDFHFNLYPQMNYFYLGELYIVRGLKQEAIQAFSKFIELEPDFQPDIEFPFDTYFYYYNKKLPSTPLAQDYLELLNWDVPIDSQLLLREFYARSDR